MQMACVAARRGTHPQSPFGQLGRLIISRVGAHKKLNWYHRIKAFQKASEMLCQHGSEIPSLAIRMQGNRMQIGFQR